MQQPFASFEHQVTGVAVSKEGRIFVNFPRWTEDAPVSVAELGRDGTLKPFPDARWNAWRNAAPPGQMKPEEHFVCVQSVVVDPRRRLWVLDPAAPGIEAIVAGGPKLVEIDLSTNAVVRTIRFDSMVAPQGSYLNDVRFTPDGRFAYLSDAGARGALVVVDLASNGARRVLDGHPTTQADPGLVVKVEGRELRRPDGRAAVFNVDGIAVSPDGKHLYYQALNGRTLYRLPTDALNDAGLSEAQLDARIERVGPSEPTDGMWMSSSGQLYITAFQDNAVKVRQPDGSFAVVIQDARLRWPDSMAEGPDGSLYVTASHIPDMPWFQAGAPAQVATTLWRFSPSQPSSGAAAN